MSVYISVCMSLYTSVCMSLYTSVCMSVCMSVCVSVCAVCMSVCTYYATLMSLLRDTCTSLQRILCCVEVVSYQANFAAVRPHANQTIRTLL